MWSLRTWSWKPSGVVSRFVRKVRTASGAVAVQVVTRRGRQVEQFEHVGSAHTNAELALLLTAPEAVRTLRTNRETTPEGFHDQVLSDHIPPTRETNQQVSGPPSHPGAEGGTSQARPPPGPGRPRWPGDRRAHGCA